MEHTIYFLLQLITNTKMFNSIKCIEISSEEKVNKKEINQQINENKNQNNYVEFDDILMLVEL